MMGHGVQLDSDRVEMDSGLVEMDSGLVEMDSRLVDMDSSLGMDSGLDETDSRCLEMNFGFVDVGAGLFEVGFGPAGSGLFGRNPDLVESDSGPATIAPGAVQWEPWQLQIQIPPSLAQRMDSTLAIFAGAVVVFVQLFPDPLFVFGSTSSSLGARMSNCRKREISGWSS